VKRHTARGQCAGIDHDDGEVLAGATQELAKLHLVLAVRGYGR
jgi:hypothetical protein